VIAPPGTPASGFGIVAMTLSEYAEIVRVRRLA
jgi:hypothetical protein